MFRSSTWRELKAVYICLSSFSVVLSGRAVQWFTDNRNIPSIIRNGSMKRDLHEISLSIFQLVLRNGIDLQVDWIPRSLNEHADAEKLPEIVLGSRADSTLLSPTSTVLSDRVLGPTDLPRSQCRLLLRLTFLYTCSVFSSLDGSLVDARFMAMALLAFAGFLRFDELANLKLKDLALHDTHFELFIESSKTDQYHEGAIVPTVKSGTDF